MFSLAKDYEQLSLVERISQVGELPCSQPMKFLDLLATHIDLPTLIPVRFHDVYYASETNKRTYSLESMMAIMLLMHFFKFANASNFAVLLALSPTVREFCRLPDNACPDESVLSKFKITFEKEIGMFFENLASIVMDIFDKHDDSLPDNSPDKGLHQTLIYDTTGLKPKVKENNPKTLASEVKRQSDTKKYLDSLGKGQGFNVYSAAFKNMTKQAAANSAIKLGYANGHFGYFYKFGIVTNGFGIPLHIHFLDDDFFKQLPHEFDSPEQQKYTFDNASLFPALSAFFYRIGSRQFHTFLGDSEFDSFDNFGFLDELGFSKILIPINSRNSSDSTLDIPRDSNGIPCCPKVPERRFIYNGRCKGKNRSLRFKFVCPKARRVGTNWVSVCQDTCRHTNSVVTPYPYPTDELRTFPGILRGSKQWRDTYKRRTVIEREIASLKSHPALERPNTYNSASMRADVFLNASAKLLTIIMAFALGKPSYMRNLKNLMLAA